MLNYLKGSLVTQWHRYYRSYEGKQYCEYKRFGQPTLH